MPPRFSKVGSLKLIFWLETEVSWIEFLLKFVSQELKFSQNQQKLEIKNANFFSKNRRRVSGAGEGLEMVGLWSYKMAWKGKWGVLRAVNAPLPPPGTSSTLVQSCNTVCIWYWSIHKACLQCIHIHTRKPDDSSSKQRNRHVKFLSREASKSAGTWQNETKQIWYRLIIKLLYLSHMDWIRFVNWNKWPGS